MRKFLVTKCYDIYEEKNISFRTSTVDGEDFETIADRIAKKLYGINAGFWIDVEISSSDIIYGQFVKQLKNNPRTFNTITYRISIKEVK